MLNSKNSAEHQVGAPGHESAPAGAGSAASYIEIDFKHLDDGRVVELVEDPADAAKTKLAVFDGGIITLADAVDYRGQVLVPVGRATHGLEDINLPSAPQPYRSVGHLFFRVMDFINAWVSLPGPYSVVISAAVFNSWFGDKLQPPIYMLITGLPQSGKTTLLQTMRLICRRPLLVSEITPAATNDTCSRFACTLLMDENDWRGDKNSRNLRKQLRAGTSKGVVTRLVRKTQHAYGMKILSSLELPDDAALRSRCIHVPMDESDQTDLKKPWDPEVANAAEALRCQLLQFRLERYTSISPHLIPGAEKLRPRSRDLLSSLLAPLKDLGIVHQMLLLFFLLSHDPSTLNLLSPEQSAVAAALFEFIHICPQVNFVSIGTLTTLANQMLCAAGERFNLASRKWSDVLTGLGFGQRGRSNEGSYLPLHKETIGKIHTLKRNHGHGWPTSQGLRELMEECQLCNQRTSLTPSDSNG